MRLGRHLLQRLSIRCNLSHFTDNKLRQAQTRAKHIAVPFLRQHASQLIVLVGNEAPPCAWKITKPSPKSHMRALQTERLGAEDVGDDDCWFNQRWQPVLYWTLPDSEPKKWFRLKFWQMSRPASSLRSSIEQCSPRYLFPARLVGLNTAVYILVPAWHASKV